MSRLLVAAGVALALAACSGGDSVTTVAVTEGTTVTDTKTETVTVTVPAAVAVGLPRRVAEKHAAMLAAAESGDYEALRPLIPEQFSYTFGLPAEGGPIEYWRRIEQESGDRPIEVLAQILNMPYTLYRGTYIWPFAYDKQPDELTRYERRLLGELADDFGAGSGYLGWRAGLEPDGTWIFFIAGD